MTTGGKQKYMTGYRYDMIQKRNKKPAAHKKNAVLMVQKSGYSLRWGLARAQNGMGPGRGMGMGMGKQKGSNKDVMMICKKEEGRKR